MEKEKAFQTQANEYARHSIETIREWVEQLDSEDISKREEAEQMIQEDPLCIEVRSGWTLVTEKLKVSEYNILLTTGGPAARIIGLLDEHLEPITAKFQYQDWGQPWTDARTAVEENKIMLRYAQQFCFSDGD